MVLAMHIRGIHHLTVAVNDLDAARATFGRLFSAPAGERANVARYGIGASRVAIGDDVLELATPLSPGNPVARFLQRKGEGFYNLALEVDDIDAAVAEARQQGARISDPVEAEPGLRSAFLAMGDTHGLSIQLVQVLGAAAEPDLARPEEAEPQPEAAPEPVRDLTPDEWSDVD